MSKIFRVEKFSDDLKYYYFFNRKFAKKLRNCFYFLKKKEDDYYTEREWYVGWHDWKFDISYEECGYDSGNAELNISILGWHSVFKLPWKSKRFPDGDCDAPKWGIAIHDATFWLYKGGEGNWGGGSKWWTWNIPFWTKIHVRHDVQCNVADYDSDPTLMMIHSDQLERKDSDGRYIPLEENELVYKYHYDYKDKYDGEVIPCTFWIEEREWRPKWLTWTGRWKDVDRYIEIVFDKEVGRRKGSWKGGCLGCSYSLKEGESPMDCIKRMEKEREF